jgi:hypothetical protein
MSKHAIFLGSDNLVTNQLHGAEASWKANNQSPRQEIPNFHETQRFISVFITTHNLHITKA